MIVTTTADRLGRDFIGRRIDETFVRDLPDGVDVCGENGEYHTFCYAGGPFRTPVQFALGEPLQRSYPVKLDDGTVLVRRPPGRLIRPRAPTLSFSLAGNNTYLPVLL